MVSVRLRDKKRTSGTVVVNLSQKYSDKEVLDTPAVKDSAYY